MLSRVADNLYWFGRYLQRAENTARLVNVHAHLLLDIPRKLELGWAPLVHILGAGQDFESRHGECGETNVVRFLLLDPDNPASIASSLHRAREILRTVRDCAPREAWEHLNDLHMFVQERGEKALPRAKRLEFLNSVIDHALLIYGLLASNMSRDVGFQFLRLGTNLEQADMTTRIMDVRSSSLIQPQAAEDLSPFQNIQWMSVLRSLEAYQMYRRHVRTRVTGASVLRFLLQNREFPRSVMFCLTTAGSTLPRLPANRAVERALERTRGVVQDADMEKLVESGLHELLDEIQIGLGQVHEALTAAYFRTAA
ncbi:MAG: alpha-E domain-containing protein [Gammaproteobacteria bacterium]|nr:alpha-E domain-containing protein [Gammaproteobacteria bacterium]